MNKLLKHMTTAFAVVAMLVGTAGSVKASTNANYDITKTALFYNDLSQYTGVPVDELKKMQENGYDLCDTFGVYVNEDAMSSKARGSIGSTDVKAMTQSQYNGLIKNLQDGDILMTKDSWSVGGVVNHGHCCLVDDVRKSTNPYTVYVIEAFGPNTVSARYQLGKEYNHWRKYQNVRVYYPWGTSSTTRNQASNYAYSYLRGKKYDPIANCESEDWLSCSTLVYRAYRSIGVYLDKSMAGWGNQFYYTTYPRDIVKDDNNYCKYRVNWGGDSHSW